MDETSPQIHATVKIVPYIIKETRLFAPLKKLVLLAAVLIEKIVGTSLLMRVPLPGTHFSYEMRRLLNVSSTLQEMGIIKNLRTQYPEPDEPFVYSYAVQPEGNSTNFFNEEHALWAAVAEGMERSLWRSGSDFYRNRTVEASYKKVQNRALDIFSLAGFSEEQKKKNEILRFDEHTTFTWVPGYSITNRRKMLCPLQLVSVEHFRSRGEEPMLRWAVTTGLSTGITRKEAVVKGILEVIERDAFMITYLNRLSPPVIDVRYLAQQDHEIAQIIQEFARYNLELHAIELPTDFNVHIILAVIRDRTGRGPALTLGARADTNLKSAVLAAAAEALAVRNFAKPRYTKPFDTKKIGHTERILYWSQHTHMSKLDFLLAGKKIQKELVQEFYHRDDAQTVDVSYEKLYGQIRNELRQHAYEACYVELSSKDIRKLGLHTVFVIIPELQPLHLMEEIPYLGGNRLREVPKRLGYTPAEKLNTVPHPFP